MNAGHEATVHALGNALAILLETKRSDPPGWRALQAMLQSSDGTRAIVEETLRFDPPLHLFTRYALETVELEGQTFDVGDKIGLLLAAANRDPTVYDLPDDFDPSRYLRKEPAAQPLSFGAGIHFCLGASLARIELQIAIPTLLQRLPDIRLAGTPTYRDSYHFHGLTMLDVRWR
jgi:unspecific monooxygenase